MTFTNDETGEKFEELENDYSSMEGRIVIKPIPLKPKWEVNVNTDGIVIRPSHQPQANEIETICIAVEVLLEYLNKPIVGNIPDTNIPYRLENKFMEARTAFQKGAK